MRFCRGLGGKQEAYVRCSSNDRGAVFTSGGRHVYHALPMTEIEEKIVSLAKFIMAFQKAYVEYNLGTDFHVTWDSNLLHHVVGPIAKAVYKPHSDYSRLLCTLSDDEKTHVIKMCTYQIKTKCKF
jgi:hypothetical protein